MIIEEKFTVNGKKFINRYSDRDVFILQDQTGTKYASACDLETAPYTYTETNEPIHPDETQPEEVEVVE